MWFALFNYRLPARWLVIAEASARAQCQGTLLALCTFLDAQLQDVQRQRSRAWGHPQGRGEGTMPLTKLINENYASLAGWPEIGSCYGAGGLAGLCCRAPLENARF